MMMLARIRIVLTALAGLALASMAGAQARPDPKEFKAPPVLPKMAAPSNLPGMVAAVPAEDVLLLDLSSGGRVRIVMRPDVAPKHVERIRTLVRQGFYDGTIFHRVIEGFMAQGGDPTGTGQGGSKLPDLEPEFNDLPHVRGAVSMARAQAMNSANSQFFIVFQPVLKLDRTYTVWGRVTDGMAHVDAIVRGEPPENPTRIIKASIGADNVPPPAPSSPIPAGVGGLSGLTTPGIPPGTPPASTPPPPRPRG
jgi:peptidylprolyl isomerase